jgi:hypothetical protein
MRTTIDLPDILLRQAKARAALDGITLKALFCRCVEQGLTRTSSSDFRGARRRSEIPIINRAEGRVMPARTNADLLQLLDEEDAERAGLR